MAFNRNSSFNMQSAYQQQASLTEGKVSNGGPHAHGAVKLPQGIEYFSWPKQAGNVELNILPFMYKGEAKFFLHTRVHELPNLSDPNAMSHRYVCPRMLGKKCPVCDYKDSIDGEGVEYDAIKAYVPKQRTFMLVQQIVNGVPENKVRLLECATTQQGNSAFPQKLMSMAVMMANGSGPVQFASVQGEQWTVVVNVVENPPFRKGGKPWFGPSTVMFKPRAQEISDEILNAIPDDMSVLFDITDKDIADMKTLIEGGDISVAAPAQQAPTQQATAQQYQQITQAHLQQRVTPPDAQQQFENWVEQKPAAPSPSQQNPAPQQILTDADFARDPYQQPARSFPSEQAAPATGFTRTRV